MTKREKYIIFNVVFLVLNLYCNTKFNMFVAGAHATAVFGLYMRTNFDQGD